MDFADILLQHIQKSYTRPADMISIIFAIIAGFTAFAALAIAVGSGNLQLQSFGASAVMVLLLVLLIFYVKSQTRYNEKVVKLERCIMINYDNITSFDMNKRKQVINLLEKVFSKKGTEENLQNCIHILESKLDSNIA